MTARLFRGLAVPLLAMIAAVPAAVPAQTGGAYQASDADQLAAQMRILATSPTNVTALATAAELTLKMGDVTAATALLGRADRVDPRNPRLKADRGVMLVRSERPGEALRMFALAESLGWPAARMAADRGLAYDLIGENERAQREYRLALQSSADDEVTRRYALSLGISGQRERAEQVLDTLLRRSDRAAWRDRAFILAMNGDSAGAEHIASTMMPGAVSTGLASFFPRLAAMGPVDRAFAVTFGEMRASPERLADRAMIPPLPPLAPDPNAAVRVAQATPLPMPTSSGRRRGTQLAQAAPVAAARAAVTPAASGPALPTSTAAAVPTPYVPRAQVPAAAPIAPRAAESDTRVTLAGSHPIASSNAPATSFATPAAAPAPSQPVSQPVPSSSCVPAASPIQTVPLAPSAVASVPAQPSGAAPGAAATVQPTAPVNTATAPFSPAYPSAVPTAPAMPANNAGAGTPAPAFIAPAPRPAPRAIASPLPVHSAPTRPAPVRTAKAETRSAPEDDSTPDCVPGTRVVHGRRVTRRCPAVAPKSADVLAADDCAPRHAVAGRRRAAPTRCTPAEAKRLASTDEKTAADCMPKRTARGRKPAAESRCGEAAATRLAQVDTDCTPRRATRGRSAVRCDGDARAVLEDTTDCAPSKKTARGKAATTRCPATSTARDDNGDCVRPRKGAHGKLVAQRCASGDRSTRDDADACAPPKKGAHARTRACAEETRLAQDDTDCAPAGKGAHASAGTKGCASDRQAARDDGDDCAPRKGAHGKAAAQRCPAGTRTTDKDSDDCTPAKAARGRHASARSGCAAPARAEPSRIWVQVAGGATEGDLSRAWTKARGQAPAAFKGKQGWTTPLRATNRVLAGPFEDQDAAQAFVNQLKKAGVSGFVFTSDPGQKVTRLPSGK